MSELLTGFCPNCGNKLVYAKNESTVMCNACDSIISVSEFTNNSSSVGGEGVGAIATMPAMMMGFDNPESGVIFIENFFENYDWIGYAIDTDIAIPEIAEVVKNNKMKNGACAISWYLDYKALAYPVRKKIEGLAQHQQEMGKLYNPVDSTEALTLFDSYRNICAALKKAEKDIFKQLETAISYAQKTKLDADKLNEITNDIADLKKLFANEVVAVKEITEIPAYVEASKAASRVIAAQLAEKGINAEEIYAEAVAKYNDGTPNKNAALVLFEQVRGYEDSANYIKKINQYFSFNEEVYRAFGKHFIYKEEDYAPTLDLKELKAKGCNFLQKKKKAAATPAEDAPQAVKALSLYEVVDGLPAKEATIKGITKILTCYGSRLYYIKSNAGIHCFDIYSRTETCICKGDDADFTNDKGKLECKIMSNGSSFYMVKLFKEEKVAEIAKKGCAMFKKKSKTPAAPQEDHKLNPYCVVVVDMKSNTCKSVIKEMVEFERNYGDKIFYYYAYKPEVVKSGCLSKFKKVEEPETKKRLMVCDMIKGTSKEISEDCQLHTVCGDNIIYSMWKPNQYNKDLHAFNIETDEDVLIEKNVYNFYKVIEGKVYYTVGNATYSPLVRNEIDGSNRIEIMPNIRRILFERGGWLYVQKGTGRNSLLAKISSDGKDVVIICTQFADDVRFEGNYLYYLDTYNHLRVVRVDGKFNRKLAENVTKIFPCEAGLYYTRQETVANGESALSLYLMDNNGRNIKKMVFNVDTVQNDPTTNTLYHSKTENVRFKVYAPKQEDKATYEFHKITKYSILDKATGISKQFLTLGWPSSETKSGCLKKKNVSMIYEEAPIRPTYERESIADTTDTDEIAVEAPATLKLPGCIPESSGCAKFLKKIPVGGKGNLPNKGGLQSAKAKLSSLKLGKAKKSSKPTASKNSAKLDPKVLALTLMAFVFLAIGVSMFTRSLNAHKYGYGLPPFLSILCIVAGGVLAVLGLAIMGILPIRALKGKKLTAVLYILAAIMWLLAGVWNIGDLFGGHSSGGDKPAQGAETVQVDNYFWTDLESNNVRYYSIYIEEDGNYVFDFTDVSNTITLEINSIGVQEYIYSDHQVKVYLYSGTHTFALSSNYYDGIGLKISKFAFAENAIDVMNDMSSSTIMTGYRRTTNSNNGATWYKFTAPASATYSFSLDSYNTNQEMIIYTNGSQNGSTYRNDQTITMYSGDTIYIEVYNAKYLTIRGAEMADFDDNASLISARSAYDDYQTSASVSLYSNNLYKFVAPTSDWYNFSLDSYSNAYLIIYQDGDKIGEKSTYSTDIVMEQGEAIYVEVCGVNDYSDTVYLTVDGDGMSPDDAIVMSTGSTYTATVEAGGYVWFKTSSSLDCYNYTYWFEISGSNSGYKDATVYYENNYGSYSSDTSGQTYSSDMSVTLPTTDYQRIYYIRIYCAEATEITVSYDYNY